jgi:hypothetical protein
MSTHLDPRSFIVFAAPWTGLVLKMTAFIQTSIVTGELALLDPNPFGTPWADHTKALLAGRTLVRH